jgi:signal transduction histidine kinase
MKASSTELFEFNIVPGEFYLSQLMDAIKKNYEDKLNLLKIEFCMMPFQDKILVGDRNRLIDVFDNIFQNAIKYGDGRNITISCYEEDNCLLISVYNSGIPLPAIHLHHMFDSFWRGENATGKQGNGLGLYICKQLMRKMEGDIFAEVRTDGMGIVLVLNKY